MPDQAINELVQSRVRAIAPDVARVFLALLPGDEVKAALAAQRDQWQWPEGAVCYAPEDWHLTLHFIGAVPRHRLDEMCAGLMVPVEPFELVFGQPELWSHGLAVWCPLTVPDGLRQLHAHLGEAVRQLGLKTDPRPYRPHITLARHAAQALAPLAAEVLDWQVHGYALMESTGDPTERYRVLLSSGTLS